MGAIGGDRVGMVVAYELKNDQWVQVGDRMYYDAPNTLYVHGISMTGDGSAFAMYVPSEAKGRDTGSVKVYQRTSSGWEQVGKTLEGEAENDRFGYAPGRISISDNGRLAVGAKFQSGYKKGK